MAGLWFEQFEIGRVFDHEIRRTVTEADNMWFSNATYNPAAIHIDAEYCKTTEFGKPLVNSIFTLGLVIGLSVQNTTLTVAEMPSHSHPITLSPDSERVIFFQRGFFTGYVNENSSNPNTTGYQQFFATATAVGGGGSHGHGLTLNSLDMNVRYTDVIVCSKA